MRRVALVDPRLRPLNAVLALLRADGAWFHNLADQGFRLHSIELPVQSSGGLVRADAAIYRETPDLILLCEGKSGRNIEEKQARGYDAADYKALRRAASMPGIFGSREVPVGTMYVALEDHRADLEAALSALNISAPVLTIAKGFVRLDDCALPPGLQAFRENDPRKSWPPARVKVDHQSPLHEIMELLAQRIVAAQARRAQILDLEDVGARIYPAWAVLSSAGRRDLTRRLVEAGDRLAKGGLRGSIRVERGNDVAARIVILKTPADADPRGMPQAWQGEARHLGEALGRGSAPIPEDRRQLSLDDLDLGEDDQEEDGAPDEG
jgi:hypothetical protein